MVRQVRGSNIGELVGSLDVGGTNFTQQGPGHENPVVDFVYHDLPANDQLIFEHVTGYGGAPVLPTREISKKTGLSVHQVGHRRRRIASLIRKAQGD